MPAQAKTLNHIAVQLTARPVLERCSLRAQVSPGGALERPEQDQTDGIGEARSRLIHGAAGTARTRAGRHGCGLPETALCSPPATICDGPSPLKPPATRTRWRSLFWLSLWGRRRILRADRRPQTQPFRVSYRQEFRMNIQPAVTSP